MRNYFYFTFYFSFVLYIYIFTFINPSVCHFKKFGVNWYILSWIFIFVLMITPDNPDDSLITLLASLMNIYIHSYDNPDDSLWWLSLWWLSSKWARDIIANTITSNEKNEIEKRKKLSLNRNHTRGRQIIQSDELVETSNPNNPNEKGLVRRTRTLLRYLSNPLFFTPPPLFAETSRKFPLETDLENPRKPSKNL